MGGTASVVETQTQQQHLRDLNHSHSDEYNRLAASVLSDAETLRSRRGSVTGRERHGSISHEVTIKSLALLQLSHNLQSNKSFDHENADKPLISRDVSAERTIPRNRSRDVVISNHTSREKEDKEGSGVVILPKLPPKKYNNKKPNLNIRVTSDSGHSDDSLFEGLGSSGKSTQRAGVENREAPAYGGSSPPRRPSTPHVPAIVSPSGTLHVGNWNINEDGITAVPPATIRRDSLHEEELEDSMEGRILAAMNGDNDHPPFSHQFLSSGRCDFVEIGTLGNGASGSVVEAIHVPTLTLVALKMLPIYQADKLQNISRELNVLYQNLAELKLVDDSLEDVNSPTPPGGDFIPLIDKKMSGSGSTIRSRPSPPVSRKTSPQNSFKGNSPPLPRSTKTSPLPPSGKNSTALTSSKLSSSTTVASEKPTGKRTPPSGNFVQMSRCPQMLSLYDAFTNPKSGMVNLVVEYMDGGSLQDLVMHGGCADEEVLADIAYQVLSGLSFLHSNNKMHRDIKPGNILLSCRGVIKLADFGISRALDGSYKMANTFIGTMCYMAPERIGGENYGYPSDTWSFGLTLLAVAKGAFPLKATDGGYWGLLKAICDEDPPTPGEQFSDEFNDFVGCCLRKDPTERSQPQELLHHPFLAQYIDDFEEYDSPRRRMSFFSHPPKTVRSSTTDGSTVMSRTSSSVSENNYSTPLSKLASRRYRHSSSTASCDNIPEHAVKTYRSAAISALEAKDGGIDDAQLALAREEEDMLVEAMVERIRMDHLQRILEKIEMKYESLEKVVYDSDSGKESSVHNCNSGDQSSVRTSTSSQRYNLELIEEARRTLRVRIPNFDTGQHKWRHLASQLMLPEEVVLDAAQRHLSTKYLEPCK